jgi:hypothetical protein
MRKAAVIFETPSFRFPLQAGGTKTRFPSRSGGNLKEGGLGGINPCRTP